MPVPKPLASRVPGPATIPPLSRQILMDTGPLVAWLDRSDADHGLCSRFLAKSHGPLLFTWPVVSEVCHKVPSDVALRLLEWIQLGGLQQIEIPPAALQTISS